AYLAARESAVVFDLTGWTAIRLSGRDAVKFLHNFCTSDIKQLGPFQGCETFFTNVKARVVGHGFAFRGVGASGTDEGRDLDLLLSPGQVAALVPHLDRYLITEDVTITDRTPETGVLFVTGPTAATTLEAAGLRSPNVTPSELSPLSMLAADVERRPVSVRRVDLLGGPGFLIDSDPAAVSVLRARLSENSAVNAGSDAFDALRVEACFPLYGIDVTEDHLAPEVGRPWTISYTKGCYLGQEPIARIDALGHVNRLLRGLRLESGPAPDCGAAVLAEGKEIGTVTSATTSFADGRPVALGYLRTTFAGPGTAVTVRTLAGDVPATVYGPPGA
ncbi:MAG TPA: glycine cleavage T C-terminal barrel domain-containing protein, partial [Planctomycetaceae bacterium]